MSEVAPESVYDTFTRCFNTGDLDGLVAMYEPNATFVRGPNDYASGASAIREGLQGFIALKGTLTMQVRHAVRSGDLALLSNEWTLNTVDGDGKPMKLSGKTSEVVRRQADGRWLFVIDHPYGAQD